GGTRGRMLRELADVVEALTVEHPLVLVLEDLHWSDAATVDLVAYLAQRRESARLLLLGTYRPVEAIVRRHPLRAVVQELVLHREGEELALESVTEAAVAQYLAGRCGGGDGAGGPGAAAVPAHGGPPALHGGPGGRVGAAGLAEGGGRAVGGGGAAGRGGGGARWASWTAASADT